MSKDIHNQDGHTLIELAVAITIFGILMLVVYSAFFSTYKSLGNQMMLSQVNRDATIAMKRIKGVIEDYGNLTVVNDQLSSSGSVLLDFDGNASQEGSQLSLDTRNHLLVASDGHQVVANVKRIQLIEGPVIFDGLGVMNDVILIVIDMEHKDVTFRLKGGVNVKR